MFKFIHAADIHLDSPLLNLQQYDGAPVDHFRNATRSAFDRLVALAIEQQVRFVLIAGDLYDGECRDSSTPLHFRRQMARLAEHGVDVFVIQGNHDAVAKKAFSFDLPRNVHLFAANRPETIRLEDLGVALHGQGFADRAVSHDLSQNYPESIPAWLNIGLLHTSCGHYESHDTYAPSSIRGLTEKGYEYWALGHVHQRQVLAQGRSWIVYSGNTQGRHIREAGPKSCEIVTVEHGEIQQVRRHHVDVVRWYVCPVDAGPCAAAEEVVTQAQCEVAELISRAEGRPLAVRLEVAGVSPVHRELVRHRDHWDRQLREAMVNQFDDQVWLEKIRFRTASEDRSSADLPVEETSAQVLSHVGDLAAVRTAFADLRDELAAIFTKYVPTDPRADEDRIDLDDENLIHELARDVKELLSAKLLHSEDTA